MEDPEVILCKVPVAKECALYLTNIIWDGLRENLWYELYEILSEFGLLYNVFVTPSKFGNEKNNCFYGFARYFSQRSAAAALSNADRICINSQKVKVSRLPHNYDNFKNLKLNSKSLGELISYYFGFNYWSSQILYLEREPNEDSKLRYTCMVRVTTKDHLMTEGVAIGEAPLTNNHNGGLGIAHKLARKFAVENATSLALSKFVIIEFSNGKRLMEVDTTQPDPLYINPSLDDPMVKEIRELEDDPEAVAEEEEEVNADKEFKKSEWIENLSDSTLEKLLSS